MLLRTDTRAGSHQAHESDRCCRASPPKSAEVFLDPLDRSREDERSLALTFISRKPMFVNQIRANQRPRPAQPSLAMNRDGPSLREVDEPATHLEGRVRAVVEIHLDVVDPATDKVDRVVQFLVQPAGRRVGARARSCEPSIFRKMQLILAPEG